jgi:MFS family permease
MPVVDVLKSSGGTVLLAAGTYLAISSLGYIVLVYFITYATRQLGLTLPIALTLVMIAAGVCAPSLLFAARLSDRVGRKRLMRWGLAALILWSLIFFPLLDTKSLPLIALSIIGMLFVQGFYLGPQPAVMSELFPTAVRYSGSSLAVTLASVCGGAVAPLVATYLFNQTGTSSLITVYMVAVSIVSWLCALALPETYRDNLAARD